MKRPVTKCVGSIVARSTLFGAPLPPAGRLPLFSHMPNSRQHADDETMSAHTMHTEAKQHSDHSAAEDSTTSPPAVRIWVDDPPPADPPGSSPAAGNEGEGSNEHVLASLSPPASPTSSNVRHESLQPGGYLSYLRCLRAAWSDMPDVTITYEKLRLDLTVPVSSTQLPNLWSSYRDKVCALNPCNWIRAPATTTTGTAGGRATTETAGCVGADGPQPPLRLLHACTGMIRPGELTLVLSPPGHGKSVLLKTLAGRMQRDGGMTGDLRWNGLTASELAASGLHLEKLCAYVDQGDVHYPVLTVRETFAFAVANSNADTRSLGVPKLNHLQAHKVEHMLQMLGLKECADTIVGNALIRGVSGGQRRRVSLGEMLLSQARALFLDEISTGLDAATTFDIVSALRDWTRTANGSATISLLQPTPETFHLFDKIILMREGQIVFSGSHPELLQHLQALRIEPDEEMDLADWLIDFLSDPARIWKRDIQAKGRRDSFLLGLANQPDSEEVLEGCLAPAASTVVQDYANAQATVSSFESTLAPPSMRSIAFSMSQSLERAPLSAPPQPTQPPRPSLPTAPVASVPQEVQAVSPASSIQEITFHLGDGDDDDEPEQKEIIVVVGGGGSGGTGSSVGSSLAPSPHSSVTDTSSSFPARVDAPPQELRMRDRMLGRIVSSRGIPLTTLALRRSFERSHTFHKTLEDLKAAKIAASADKNQAASNPPPSEYTRAQLYQHQSHSNWVHLKSCIRREVLFLSRNPRFVYPRLMVSVLLGLVMGTLYHMLQLEDFAAKIGLINVSCLVMAFNNLVSVQLATQFKHVVWKQVDGGFYSTHSYVLAMILVNFPLSLADVTIFSSILYPMAGFAPETGRFFFFLLIMLSMNLVMGCAFRLIGFAASHSAVASALISPFITILNLFGGFLLTADKVPVWLTWAYWISPFSWAIRSLAQNELHSARYDAADVATELGLKHSHLGDQYLSVYQISVDERLRWTGAGYLFALWMVLIGLATLALHRNRSWLTRGTKRSQDAEAIDAGDEEAARLQHQRSLRHLQQQLMSPSRLHLPLSSEEVHEVRIGMQSGSALRLEIHKAEQDAIHAVTIEPMNLSFKNLRYTVPVEQLNKSTGKKEIVQRTLLGGIDGFARAGELTALMGSSGAGKTTLMDVIAGRKTSGTITGEILVNGHPQTFPLFNRLVGYCEQMDTHVGTSTVRDALELSARLRLPSSVSAASRAYFVSQLLEDLELASIADRMIGDVNILGLSPGELKRVTIGVELAANPTFLFLDEPTSGLDARAALIVLRVIRKIAGRGRSVFCTIHQPSAELFSMFDRLMLLKSGGVPVYFGPIGDDAQELVSYFLHAPIGAAFSAPAAPGHLNPAVWMLDVVGAGTAGASSSIAPYEKVYEASDLKQVNMALLEQVAVPSAHRAKPGQGFTSYYAASYSEQFRAILGRLFVHYFRDLSYYGLKNQCMLALGIVFGLVYQGIDDTDEPGLVSKLAIMNLSCGFVGLIHCFAAMPVILRLRESFYRERSSHMYAPWVYSTTLALVEMPFLLVSMLCFLLPFYWLVGFEASAWLFFRFLFVVYFMALLFVFMGHLLASALPNIQIVAMVQGAIVSLFFLFSGVYIRKGSMPHAYDFAYYIDPVPKGFVALGIQQFYCEGPNCPRVATVEYGSVTQWEFVSRYLSSGGPEWEQYYIGYLFLSLAVVFTAVNIVVLKVSHIKR